MILRSIPIIFLFLSSVFGFSQIQEEWYGHYKGDLVSTNSKGDTYVYNMELVFKPISDTTWNWTIIYGEDSLRQVRDYTLILKEDTYYIDEKNGIVLENQLFDDHFSSFFEVQGNYIQAIYKFIDGEMEFILTSSQLGYSTGGEDVTDVQSYSTSAFQRAVLKKI
ncbi:MAG: hypothetical protein MK078_00670 [Crocinitomicaceae bacterium]|nr:hypothetical protein [Crocinitomicaceae bacterium]